MPWVGMPPICGATDRVDHGDEESNCSVPVMSSFESKLAAAAFVVVSSGPCTGVFAPPAGSAIAQPKPTAAPSALSISVWNSGHGVVSARLYDHCSPSPSRTRSSPPDAVSSQPYEWRCGVPVSPSDDASFVTSASLALPDCHVQIGAWVGSVGRVPDST